ncbi:MAG: hypothetical protein OXI82_00845, partial [Nitrospinae bacterium]|nr:hypothetical protein [Nitrospinota bacterium]
MELLIVKMLNPANESKVVEIREYLMILKFRVFAIIFVVFGVLPFPGYAQSADIALINGKVLTVDADFSTEQAVAVQGERIVSV